MVVRRIVVVVVSFNNAGTLGRCLRSLESSPSIDVDVVVVDNASSDGSSSIARAAHEQTGRSVDVVELASNIGFAPAVNIALSRAGEYDALLLVNPDAELRSAALATLVDALERDPGLAAVGPRILDEDGADQLACLRSDLDLFLLFCKMSGLRRISPRWFGGHLQEAWDRRRSRDAQCLSGACMLVRAEALQSVGELDTTIPMYFEDIDLCRRLRDAGWRLRFEASAQVDHLGAHSAAASPARRALRVMEDGDAPWLFIRRYEGAAAAAAASVIIGLGSAFRLLLLGAASVLERDRVVGSTREGTIQKYADLLRWSLRRRKPVHRTMPV